MNPQTLPADILRALAAPTWGNGIPMAFQTQQAEQSNAPTARDVAGFFKQIPTAPTRDRSSQRFAAVESVENARRASVERLQNKVVEFKVYPPAEASEDERTKIRMAAAIIAELISEIPENLPLPKVMILSSQISLYWDFGETYAELAVSGDGHLSIYGRRPGRSDVLEDTTVSALRKSGLGFPTDLDGILFAF